MMSELERRIEEKRRKNMSSKEREERELLDRIVKGAEYIDSLSKDDPKYPKAMKKYDELCEEFLALRWDGKWIGRKRHA